ncbi:hypothetical protein C8J46_10830 [Sphingomonas sp. PP-F2F-A104-K0414]|uniref:DUF2891 domain-containing protein n=1 Tax=Sphingomonas sp. PP-F2F-A104-K0414 TaxID=2135661 RepID=UPI001047B6D1|nr:DUF2891 domain-containing protein [Sphingomonas sp. PP-F2F-A104-K0414]TCP96654.1 hypothetical protein C8J46_10830 [Sphingomonas sp. PP-F2F-A104-K0414]
MTHGIDQATAARFATLTLGHLTREWPYKLDQTLGGPGDLALPKTLHPIFHGSFDWHSCVHGWWQVMRLARLYPAMPETVAIEALANHMLVPTLAAGELAYLARPTTGSFERPYGWGWLLALHDELARRPDHPWASALAPLARAFAARLAEYLPKLIYPVRSGKHDCTAFALVHALRWARTHDAALAALIEMRSRDWFGADRDCQPWEPNGEDFLSATLCEAVLMREVLGADFTAWLAAFMPDPFGAATTCLRTPAIVSDRSDGRLAHLDGVNLSRAWGWRSIAKALPDPKRAWLVADDHLAEALPHLADDYMGEHWLATFALLALDAES